MKKKFTLLLAFCAISIWSFGQIFITEIADPKDQTSARYVELYNAGDVDVDLNTGYRIQRYTNANTSITGTGEALTGIIPAKGFYLVAAVASGFESAYGFAPDQAIGTGGPADSNGDDQIQIVDPSAVVLDLFGVPGEDGDNTCHGFADGRAERIASATTGNAGTWNEANWNVWGATAATCTNHITQTINTDDGIFDPGAWIGSTNAIVNFLSASSEINEDDGTIDVCVSIINADATTATTVDINILGTSTAVNGTDYSSITFPTTLTFPAGSSGNQCLTFTITDDTDEELTDTIAIILENAGGPAFAALGTSVNHILEIKDNDTPTCDLILGTPETLCDAITADMDTYAVSIAYTGGGTSTYALTTQTGTVAGDDPSSVAAGTIMITGLTERLNDTITISNTAGGGYCDFEIPVEAQTCFPSDYGNIFITEIADPQDKTTARYVELFNAGDEDIDLNAGYGLQRYTNGSIDPQTTIHYLTGTIPAKGFYIVARDAGGFETSYGFAPDQAIGSAGPADSNGDDQIQLLDPNAVVRDLFGVPGEDGSGTCHGFEDGRAERAMIVTTENDGTWSEANWNVWGAEASGCTNHITGTVASTDNIFDPGVWIGYVPANTILNFEYLSSEISEDGTSIDVCVTILNPDATNATTVDINVLDESTAVNGTDYTSITFPQTLTFPAGSSDKQCLTITVTDDAEAELPDTLALSLENPLGGLTSEVGAQAKHVVIITDNDIICPNPGDIIISEVMQNPKAVGDGEGEWFEIHNTTGADIDLFGMLFKDDQTASEMILVDESLEIVANGYLVFAVNGDTAVNGGLRADFMYTSDPPWTLSNSTDGIVLTCLGAGIDTVIWDDGATFPDPNGMSMSLKAGFMNATDNDLGANWEEATFTYGDGDFGTPGCANDAACCYLEIEDAETSCDAATYETDTYSISINFSAGGGTVYEISSTSGTVGGDDPSNVSEGTITISGVSEGTDATVTISNLTAGGGCNFVVEVESPSCFTIVCPTEGDVIITEIMQDPSVVSDDLGEWFEIYNTTNADINLQGWNILDDDNAFEDEGFTIEGSLAIAANSYLVFANNATAGTNGGLPTPDYIFTQDYLLGNNSDGIKLECSATVIDQVVWDGGTTFPDPTGASMALHPDKYTSTDNDDGANWHAAFTAYGDGDFGTPGEVNETVSVELNSMFVISVYPNPTNDGLINISFAEETMATRSVRIYDMLGKQVFEKSSLGKDELISTNLDSGIYILKLTENDLSKLVRLVVK